MTHAAFTTRLAMASLAILITSLIPPPALQAQVQRSSTGTGSTQVDPNALRVAIDPLETEVEALRAEVSRLRAALESLRLTVNANQAAYAKHTHQTAYFGLISAKQIYAGAQSDLLLAFTAPGTKKVDNTGPPQ